MMDKYATHLGPLMMACTVTEGRILEIGSGRYSTPMLLQVAQGSGRLLTTVEENEDWYWRIKQTPGHFVHLAPDVREVLPQLAKIDWGVVFVDGHSHRLECVKALAPVSQSLVVHDAEDEPFRDPALYAGFPFVRTLRLKDAPWTTVASRVPIDF
jgi:hypothetical protein